MLPFYHLLTRALPMLVIVATAVLLLGIGLQQLPWPNYWKQGNGSDLVAWCVAICSVATLLRFCIPRHAALALILLVTVYLGLIIGIDTLLAVLYFAVAATLLGFALLRFAFSNNDRTPSLLEAMFIGLAVGMAVLGVLLHWQIYYRSIVFAMLLAPFAMLVIKPWRQQVFAAATSAVVEGMQTLQSLPFHWLVLLVTAIGYVARQTFFPTMGYDDLALHLRLWTELSWLHRASFDFQTHVWSLAPFAVDLQHAVVSLLANSDARAALNLLWFTLLIGQCWQLTGCFTKQQTSKVVVTLVFVSTPLLGYQLLGLQTELFLALIATTAVRMIIAAPLQLQSTTSLALLALAALCCATKLPAAILGLLLLGAALLKWRLDAVAPTATKFRLWWLGAFLLALAALAFHSYLNSWRLTGNPLFPLYNNVFQSPYYDTSGAPIDDRWFAGFSVQSWWSMFFSTSRFFESRDFTTGFQYLLLLPLSLLLAVSNVERRRWWPLLVPLCGFGIVMFYNIQYWRYLFPVVPLASVLLVALLENIHDQAPTRWMLVVGALLVAAGLNFWFYPGISWVFNESPYAASTERRRQLLLEQNVGAAVINQRLNETSPGLRVLYPEGEGFGATLYGQPIYPIWFSPQVLASASRIRGINDFDSFMQEQQIDAVIWSLNEEKAPGSISWLLGSYLADYGWPEYQVGNNVLYRLIDRALPYRPNFRLSAPLQVSLKPQALATLDLANARALRVSAQYNCADAQGQVIIAIRWDNGSFYYRLIPCNGAVVQFREAIAVPAGVHSAELNLLTRERPTAEFSELAIETF